MSLNKNNREDKSSMERQPIGCRQHGFTASDTFLFETGEIFMINPDRIAIHFTRHDESE
jgi:hypothetical protein